MFICSTYRPPELPQSKFIEELNRGLAKIPENAEIVYLVISMSTTNDAQRIDRACKHLRELTRWNKSLRHQQESRKNAINDGFDFCEKYSTRCF
jgi:hypothetical protein